MDLYTEPLRKVAKELTICGLAQLLGMSETRLYKKLDPDNAVNLTLEDFINIVKLTGDVRIVQPLLDMCSCIAVKRVTVEAGEESIFRLALEHEARSGALMDELLAAVDDDQIDDDELSRLEERFLDNARKAAELRAAVKAKHAADKKLKAVQ